MKTMLGGRCSAVGAGVFSVQAALEALTNAAAGGGNLLELSVNAARAKATVGEISDAMEQTFGRHRAEVRTLSNVWAAEYSDDDEVRALRHRIEAFADDEGRLATADYRQKMADAVFNAIKAYKEGK